MFSGRPSVLLSVRPCVHPSVCDARSSFMFPQYIQYLLTDFRQNFVTGASRDRDEPIRFWGQGHSMTEYIPDFYVSAICAVSVDGFSPNFCHWCILEHRWPDYVFGYRRYRRYRRVQLFLVFFLFLVSYVYCCNCCDEINLLFCHFYVSAQCNVFRSVLFLSCSSVCASRNINNKVCWNSNSTFWAC